MDSNDTQHQDVIRIISKSKQGYEDAIHSGIKQLIEGPHHKNLKFRSFEVVHMRGAIDPANPNGEMIVFEVALDVTGDHIDVPV